MALLRVRGPSHETAHEFKEPASNDETPQTYRRYVFGRHRRQQQEARRRRRNANQDAQW